MLANRFISREEHDREVERPIVLPPPRPSAGCLVRGRVRAPAGGAIRRRGRGHGRPDRRGRDGPQAARRSRSRAARQSKSDRQAPGWRGPEVKLDPSASTHTGPPRAASLLRRAGADRPGSSIWRRSIRQRCAAMPPRNRPGDVPTRRTTPRPPRTRPPAFPTERSPGGAGGRRQGPAARPERDLRGIVTSVGRADAVWSWRPESPATCRSPPWPGRARSSPSVRRRRRSRRPRCWRWATWWRSGSLTCRPSGPRRAPGCSGWSSRSSRRPRSRAHSWPST